MRSAFFALVDVIDKCVLSWYNKNVELRKGASKMSFLGYKYEKAGKWFEWAVLGLGILLVLLSLFVKRVVGGVLTGFLLIYIWTFTNGTRYGLRLQEAERRYIKSCRQEDEMVVDRGLVVRLTLMASLPMYLSFAFPFVLLPIGGFYALAFFIPLFLTSAIRFTTFYRRWEALEVKPNFYWWMQIGICFALIALSYLAYLLGFYGVS